MRITRSSSILFIPFVLLWYMFTAPIIFADTQRPGGLPENVETGELKVLNIGGKPPEQALQLPLKHTDVRITITGFVARAVVTQEYTNSFNKPIEAVYAFPLPHKAAVDAMTMHIGERVIQGIIKKRDEARQIYEQAKTEGKRTALLEQERPNIFTQSVGNIMPGDQIRIEITYVDILEFRDDGDFELVFPMVVGPRYIPGTPKGHTGGGFASDTDRVPDASHITPPVLKPGERSGHDITLTVDLDAHIKIQSIHSISHQVKIDELSNTHSTIAILPTDTIPNKDFVLRYEVAGQAPEVAVIAHHDPQQGGYFTFIALPQKQVDDSATVPRDLIFILDTSGSMSGLPMEKSKEAMYRLMDGMRPTDRFNILRFAGDTGILWSTPRPKNYTNVAEAKSFVESLQGGGGTEMRDGVVEALSQPTDGGRMRIAFLLTDGYVGNESEIIASIEQERRGARVFTLGIGSSVNRYLLDQAAVVGLGEAFYVRQDEDAAPIIDKFFKRVDRPNLAHLEIHWNGLDVTDLTPTRIPDLWQGQPILVHGRYKTGGDATIQIKGVLGSSEYIRQIPVSLPLNATENELMATVWARAKVQELMQKRARTMNPGTEGITEITDLGLKYRIMTQWTSFVAVEELVVNKDGKQQTITQPVELPEGMRYEGVFGPSQEQARPATVRTFSRRISGGRRGGMGGSGGDGGAGYYGGKGGAGWGAINAEDASPLSPSENSVWNNAVAPSVVDLVAPYPAKPGVNEEVTLSKDEKKAKSKPNVPNTCWYKALSVSGGLKYPEVKNQLRQDWPAFCVNVRSYGSASATLVRFAVNITVGTDGKVKVVTVQSLGLNDPALNAAIEAGFKQITFKSVTGGETIIKLTLIVDLSAQISLD